MTQQIKRVLVPLDTASETWTAIDTAARLAARWRVPLHCLFIEDEELVALAGLPFSRQVTAAGIEPLTRDNVEDHLRAFAERARRELGAVALRHGVEWSVAVVRGPLAADMLGGDEHDFVVAGTATRPIGRHFRVPSRWWSLAALSARPLLLVRREWETGGSVLTALHRRTPQTARLLGIAAQIAGFGSGVLTVLGAPGIAAPDGFEAWVSEVLEGHSLSLQIELGAIEPAALRQRIVELDCRLVVLEAVAPPARLDDLRQLVERVGCDVMIIH